MDETKRRILEKAGASKKLLEDFKERDEHFKELGITDEKIEETLKNLRPKKESYCSRVIDWFKGLYQ